jgi:hypothetical protein
MAYMHQPISIVSRLSCFNANLGPRIGLLPFQNRGRGEFDVPAIYVKAGRPSAQLAVTGPSRCKSELARVQVA